MTLRNVFSRWIGNIWERAQQALRRILPSRESSSVVETAPVELPAPDKPLSPAQAKARFWQVERDFRRELKQRWAQVDTANLRELSQFENWFRRQLPERQRQAYLLGKQARGDYTPLTEKELRYLHGQHSQQMKYFRRFMEDVRNRRGRMDYGRRLDLYGKDLYGIYQHAYWAGQVYTVGRRYIWRLSDAEHCEDCVRRHWESKAKGGYTWEELEKLGLPGEGKTRCRNNCKCWIEEIAEKHYKPRSARSTPPRKMPGYTELTEVKLDGVA